MPPRERPADRGRRIARADLARVGDELRRGRVSSGLTLDRVGLAAEMSGSQISRIERGRLPTASIDQLARVGAAVGLDVRVGAYPGPDPIRDAAQNSLLDRLRARLHIDLTMLTEMPLPIAGDLRAWDGMIRRLAGEPAFPSRLPVEAETRITDLQAQTRRIWLKARDSDEPYVLLVVSDTRHNRNAIRAAEAAIRDAFPIPARRALAALKAGRHPGGSAIAFL